MKESKLAVQKPFLKWVGGKTQILKTIISNIPSEMNNFHDVFLGGGSVLLAVLSLQKTGDININNKIYAYDINRVLINVFKHIQNNKEELYEHICHYINTYDALAVGVCGDMGDKEKLTNIINRKPKNMEEAMACKENYYYWVRSKFNSEKMDKDSVECSAIFMFINKTCFRGMYREGPNGFNVPYGHYKKTPTIITKEDLDYVSDLIQDVEFIHCDFRDAMKNIDNGDFAYFDPPYAPETKKSFVGYIAEGFSLDTHQTLFDNIKKICGDCGGVKFLLSNANVDIVLNNFKNYNIKNITARRAINCKNPEATTTEVLIYNYNY